jgi:hypothetical protein
MKNARVGTGWISCGLALLVAMAAVGEVSAQNTKVPSTLRYGSGLWDVPVASVLPHMAIVGTYSGFPVSISQQPQTDASGRIVGLGGEYDKWLSDASVTIGLFDRVELGATVQNFSDSDEGGTMVGGFGRLALVRPENQGFGLAVGARYVSAPSFDGAAGDPDFQAGRLAFPDARLVKDYTGLEDEVKTNFTPYAVASLQLRGFDSEYLPRHDFTFTAGWGDGHFRDGDALEWYSYADSEGFFTGAALHVELGDNALLNLIGEWNGFDINLGAQLDYSGFRIGGFVLGSNYAEEISVYRSKKFGILGSIALCPSMGGLCRPALLERPSADTIRLPAPPPDTVVVQPRVSPRPCWSPRRATRWSVRPVCRSPICGRVSCSPAPMPRARPGSRTTSPSPSSATPTRSPAVKSGWTAATSAR